MAHAYFLDSSAILKIYLAEQGSRFVRTLRQTEHDILYIAQIAGVEVISAIARQALGKHISQRKAQAAIAQFRIDFTNRYVVLALNDPLVVQAMQLAENYSLRAYDAVQLASALTLAKAASEVNFVFISADNELNTTAQSAGLLVQNPNNYP